MEGPVKLLDCPPKVGQSKSEGRVRYLDSFRGFAIILVVMGHLIQSNYASGIHNHIFNVIYGFHMPMFFFISGFSRSLEESRKGMISTAGDLMRYMWSKFLTILLPSVSWTLIVPLFFSDELSWDSRISAFWFLNVLFAVSVIWGIFSFIDGRLPKGRIWFRISALLAVAVVFVVGFKRIPLFYLMMFVLGYVFSSQDLMTKIPRAVFSAAFLLLCLIAGYYVYGYNPYGSPDRIWLMMPISVLASFALIYFFRIADERWEYFSRFLSFVGKYTLGIYLCHFMLVDIGFLAQAEVCMGVWLQVFVLSVLAILIALCCIGIQKVFSAFPYLGGILYGKWQGGGR